MSAVRFPEHGMSLNVRSHGINSDPCSEGLFSLWPLSTSTPEPAFVVGAIQKVDSLLRGWAALNFQVQWVLSLIIRLPCWLCEDFFVFWHLDQTRNQRTQAFHFGRQGNKENWFHYDQNLLLYLWQSGFSCKIIAVEEWKLHIVHKSMLGIQEFLFHLGHFSHLFQLFMQTQCLN